MISYAAYNLTASTSNWSNSVNYGLAACHEMLEYSVDPFCFTSEDTRHTWDCGGKYGGTETYAERSSRETSQTYRRGWYAALYCCKTLRCLGKQITDMFFQNPKFINYVPERLPCIDVPLLKIQPCSPLLTMMSPLGKRVRLEETVAVTLDSESPAKKKRGVRFE